MNRPPTLFARGRLTNMLVAELTTAMAPADDSLAVLVGDGVAPTQGGWPEGQYVEGLFVPYTVLLTGEATPQGPHEMATTGARSWQATYQFHSVGESRDQCDWIADRVRAAWLQLPRGDIWAVPPDDSGWRLRLSEVVRLGSVQRNSQVNPYIWECTDAAFVTVQA